MVFPAGPTQTLNPSQTDFKFAAVPLNAEAAEYLSSKFLVDLSLSTSLYSI